MFASGLSGPAGVFSPAARSGRLLLGVALYLIDQSAKNGDAGGHETSNQEGFDSGFKYGITTFILGVRKLVFWQLIVGYRLHVAEGIEDHDLAGLVGGCNLSSVFQRLGSGAKNAALTLKVDDIPPPVFAGYDVDGAPCVD
jgi:hypothetical protein